MYNTICNIYTIKIIKTRYYLEKYHSHRLLALFKIECCSKFLRIPANNHVI